MINSLLMTPSAITVIGAAWSSGWSGWSADRQRTAASFPPPNESPVADDKLGAGRDRAARHIHIQAAHAMGDTLKYLLVMASAPTGLFRQQRRTFPLPEWRPSEVQEGALKNACYSAPEQIRRVTAVITLLTEGPLGGTRLFSPGAHPRNDRSLRGVHREEAQCSSRRV